MVVKKNVGIKNQALNQLVLDTMSQLATPKGNSRKHITIRHY